MSGNTLARLDALNHPYGAGREITPPRVHNVIAGAHGTGNSGEQANETRTPRTPPEGDSAEGHSETASLLPSEMPHEATGISELDVAEPEPALDPARDVIITSLEASTSSADENEAGESRPAPERHSPEWHSGNDGLIQSEVRSEATGIADIIVAEPELDPSCERPYLTGVDYGDFLSALEQTLSARLYLEIGTRTGYSLNKISCAAVAVDPEFTLAVDAIGTKPACHFFRMRSDDFFRKIDLSKMFDEKVSLAFLDGMHRFEYLLRDFINTEKHCNRGSLIALHDCHPINLEMAERLWNKEARQSPRKELKHWWTGDVWKLLPILKQYRPELRIIKVDCPPTGLVLCTNLDPGSRVLENNYFDILEKFGELELADYGLSRLYNEFPLEDSCELLKSGNLSRRLLI